MSVLDSLIFPTDIGRGSAGGPKWATEVVINDAGYETRNNPWAYPLHEYDVAYGVKSVPQLETLVATFHAAQAMLYGFRFKDMLDFKSCARDGTPALDDQTLLTATGGETSVQLIKNYTAGGTTLARKITRPFGTVLLEINGVEKTEDTHFTVDATTGLIDLTGGTTPHGALSAGNVVKAGFSFHVPVRFNTNSLSVQLQDYKAGSASVPLVEVRE